MQALADRSTNTEAAQKPAKRGISDFRLFQHKKGRQKKKEREAASPRHSPHAQLETNDALSIGSSAGALSVHDAPSPSPDTDADMPHLLTLAEAAAELAAAEFERQRREWRCARPDSPFHGKGSPNLVLGGGGPRKDPRFSRWVVQPTHPQNWYY